MRKAGVLLHISSLPGPYGCGTFGKYAYRFADFLAASGLTSWQVLPFNLPHTDGCPYFSLSTFAQNPLFIDPEILQEKGLLLPKEVAAIRDDAATCQRDFDMLARKREVQLRLAAKRFARTQQAEEARQYVRERPGVLQACRFLSRENPTEDNLFYYIFLQYEFFRQWDALHRYLAARGIEVIGDIPYYVNLSSSEVYYNPECFLLNEDGQPDFVSGVPGDRFSDAGQKWGHPLYNTAELQKQNFRLLYDRMAFAAAFYDVTRIDHFQAVGAFYAIPAGGHPREGHWETGVGEPFIKRLVEEIGRERFVVEDFNCFPGGSYAIATQYGLPDMQIYQSTLLAGYTAASYKENTVAYLGTHDCDTFMGYLQGLDAETRQQIAALLRADGQTENSVLCQLAIRDLFACKAQRVVLQAQDLLLEGTKSRMNIPGTVSRENWAWRLTEETLALLEATSGYWHRLLTAHNRTKKPPCV
ncbi:MAG: 4-alpha-glucanotransferase [Oscillospiraceae bacterium]|nr:4-alpha-glucanotransferase [Oscillospiraceae bacterium]